MSHAGNASDSSVVPRERRVCCSKKYSAYRQDDSTDTSHPADGATVACLILFPGAAATISSAASAPQETARVRGREPRQNDLRASVSEATSSKARPHSCTRAEISEKPPLKSTSSAQSATRHQSMRSSPRLTEAATKPAYTLNKIRIMRYFKIPVCQ